MCSRLRARQFSRSATCCPWSTSPGRCATAGRRQRIPGTPRAWSGRVICRPRPSILMSSRGGPGKPITTRRSTRFRSWGRFPLHASPVVVDEHAHNNPALLHHFATEEQQKDSASLGMWLFLAQEVMFFGGMFCAYLIYRYKYFADLVSASQQLDIKLGAINTAVLICASLTVVLDVRAAQLGKRMALVGWLLLTIVLGFVFLGIKADEYAEKFEKHHVPGASFSYHELLPGQEKFAPEDRQYANPHHAEMYFSLYFAMTG